MAVDFTFKTAVLYYFNPSKSPYYPVVTSGTLGLLITINEKSDWLLVFIPLVIILTLSSFMSIRNKPDFEVIEYNEQLKFARSLGLSTAIFCLSFAIVYIEPRITIQEIENMPILVEENYGFFWIPYVCSLIQGLVFLIYYYAYGELTVKPQNRNFVQLTPIIHDGHRI